MNEQTELTLNGGTSRLQKKFNTFIAKNPSVWVLFCKFTMQAIERGHKHLSSDMILHRIRWETSIMTVGEHYKISNDTSPYFARKFHQEFPQYDGFFRTKQISQ
jgi:hypothetical protein